MVFGSDIQNNLLLITVAVGALGGRRSRHHRCERVSNATGLSVERPPLGVEMSHVELDGRHFGTSGTIRSVSRVTPLRFRSMNTSKMYTCPAPIHHICRMFTSMMFAVPRIFFGNVSLKRSPCILFFGAEMLTAPATLPESVVTGAATQRIPLSRSSSSVAYPVLESRPIPLREPLDSRWSAPLFGEGRVVRGPARVGIRP